MAIKFDGRLVLGVNQQSEISLLGAQRPLGGVPQEQPTEALTAKPRVDGKTTDAHGGKGRVARQAAGDVGRQFRNRDAARSERIVASDGVIAG